MSERERFRKATSLRIAVRRCKTLTAAKVLINDFIRTGENKLSNPRWLDKKLAQIEQLEKNNQAKKVKSLNERDSSRLSANANILPLSLQLRDSITDAVEP